MKAVQIYGWGGPVKVEEIPEPAIGDKEVLVRVKAALLSNTDPDYLEGKTSTFPNPDQMVFPMTPTSRGAGIIEKVGSRVTSFSPGDRVTVNQIVNCRQCEECYAGRDNHCPFRRGPGQEKEKSAPAFRKRRERGRKRRKLRGVIAPLRAVASNSWRRPFYRRPPGRSSRTCSECLPLSTRPSRP